MYKEYADVKLLMASLEEKADELKVKIMEDVKKSGKDIVENEHGKFILARRNNWTYSPKLQTMAEDLKTKQIDEQEKGTAKVKITEYITYKAN